MAEETGLPEHVTPATLFLCHESCPENGEIITAESGSYGRAALFKSAQFRTPDRKQAQTLEWISENWKSIMALNENEESVAVWNEMEDGFKKAEKVPFGRRRNAAKL